MNSYITLPSDTALATVAGSYVGSTISTDSSGGGYVSSASGARESAGSYINCDRPRVSLDTDSYDLAS